MLFVDRLEVWNPGALPSGMTMKSLRTAHSSVPHNPLISEPLFWARYIERAGTGTLDMIALCRKAGIPEPQFEQRGGQFVLTIRRKNVTRQRAQAQVEAQVGTKLGLSRDQVKILHKCKQESKINELMKIVSRTNRTKFRDQVLTTLMKAGLLEMTFPDKPRSSKQKYRLAKKGEEYLKKQGRGK